MSLLEKAVGASAIVMALRCALLPVLGAAAGGGLIAGAGTVGITVGVVVLVAVVALVSRRRKVSRGC